MNVENIQALIRHYEGLPELSSWGYSDCAAGVLAELGIIKNRTDDSQVADALGIPLGDARSIISGPPSASWNILDGVEKRDRVIGMLSGLFREGGVDWGNYPTAN